MQLQPHPYVSSCDMEQFQAWKAWVTITICWHIFLLNHEQFLSSMLLASLVCCLGSKPQGTINIVVHPTYPLGAGAELSQPYSLTHYSYGQLYVITLPRFSWLDFNFVLATTLVTTTRTTQSWSSALTRSPAASFHRRILACFVISPIRCSIMISQLLRLLLSFTAFVCFWILLMFLVLIGFFYACARW